MKRITCWRSQNRGIMDWRAWTCRPTWGRQIWKLTNLQWYIVLPCSVRRTKWWSSWGLQDTPEAVNIFEYNTDAAFEVAKRRVLAVIIEETIEDVFTAGNDEWKEGIKASIRSMVESALIDIVGQGLLDTTLVRYVYMLVQVIALWMLWCDEL